VVRTAAMNRLGMFVSGREIFQYKTSNKNYDKFSEPNIFFPEHFKSLFSKQNSILSDVTGRPGRSFV
jgi:hypothetical protein